MDGYEADDVIGSVTAQLDGPRVVVTGDRDLVQLIDERTSVLLTVNGGMEKWPLLDPASAEERFGVEPDGYVDLAVLRGRPVGRAARASPGIGAKTAVALVVAFGSVDGILDGRPAAGAGDATADPAAGRGPARRTRTASARATRVAKVRPRPAAARQAVPGCRASRTTPGGSARPRRRSGACSGRWTDLQAALRRQTDDE